LEECGLTAAVYILHSFMPIVQSSVGSLRATEDYRRAPNNLSFCRDLLMVMGVMFQSIGKIFIPVERQKRILVSVHVSCDGDLFGFEEISQEITFESFSSFAVT
jgi:hypothetical protein